MVGSALSAPIVIFGVFLLGGGTKAPLEGVHGMWRALIEYRALFEVRAGHAHLYHPYLKLIPPTQITVGYLRMAYYDETFLEHLEQKRVQISVEVIFLLVLLLLISLMPEMFSPLALILMGMAGTALSFAFDSLYNHMEVRFEDIGRVPKQIP